MANIGQDLITNDSESAISFNCGEEFKPGRGISYHQRSCIDLPHTNFIYNTESLNRSVHFGDVILCFKKDAQRSTNWFRENWGKHFSIAILKKNVAAKANGAAGLRNAALSFGGSPNAYATEEYNGSVWSTSNNISWSIAPASFITLTI